MIKSWELYKDWNVKLANEMETNQSQLMQSYVALLNERRLNHE